MALVLPIGSDNFGKFVEKKFDFVDKTLFIQEILDDEGYDAVVITRPRRFGKTTALSMLHYFLAPEILGSSTKGMFDKLKIASLGEKYMQHQGKYPVIFVSLKDIKESNMALALDKFSGTISRLYRDHEVLLQSDKLTKTDKTNFQTMIEGSSNSARLQESLLNLTYYLHKHYGVKPWLLLDEYDSPLHVAYATSTQTAGKKTVKMTYFDKMVNFLRGMLGGLLKTNPYLERAVLTGILRISKESMFSGLNNVKVLSILDEKYSQHFGFTQSEVDILLKKSDLYSYRDKVKTWYNGYQFGNQTMYNPWSINNFIDERGIFKTYWVNTSDNELIHTLLKSAKLDFKIEFEQLLAGKSLKKNINENVVFRYLHQDVHAIWSLLLFTGYLKPIEVTENPLGTSCQLVIPNQEVRNLYHQIIAQWLANGDPIESYSNFIESLINGDIETFEHHLARILLHVVSYHDFAKEPEAFYHGLLLGFTASLTETHIIQSNRESGDGRFDIALIPRDAKQLGILIELKIAKSKTPLRKAANDALAQINAQRYAAVFDTHPVTNLLKIGIGFRNKECVMVSAIN